MGIFDLFAGRRDERTRMDVTCFRGLGERGIGRRVAGRYSVGMSNLMLAPTGGSLRRAVQ